MFLETVKSEGLAHLSYIFGDKGEAAVIDPRRDSEIYVDIARKNNASIKKIFETHRNEDYVIGSTELAEKTGAEIFHGKNLEFEYGSGVSEGDTFDIGDIKLKILETPGHTYESISITLSDTSAGPDPVAVFTGDALFVGDVGRTDFFPDKAEEVAGLLYDSLFNKLLPLGDHVIVFPAHGAGSVCGRNMSSREFSTIGYEKKYNAALQNKDRRNFIKYKIREHHNKPPYFKMMEEYNLKGAPYLGKLSQPKNVGPEEFKKKMYDNLFVIDIRSPEAFAGAFVPGSLSIPLKLLPMYAGWFLPYNKPIGLVTENPNEIETAVRYLSRLGYDNVECYLDGGLRSWELSGNDYDRIRTLPAIELNNRIENKEKDFILLDVRSKPEYEEGKLENSTNIFIGELAAHTENLPKDELITAFCASGMRSSIAASLLKKEGFKNVEVCLGSIIACQNIGCNII